MLNQVSQFLIISFLLFLSCAKEKPIPILENKFRHFAGTYKGVENSSHYVAPGPELYWAPENIIIESTVKEMTDSTMLLKVTSQGGASLDSLEIMFLDSTRFKVTKFFYFSFPPGGHYVGGGSFEQDSLKLGIGDRLSLCCWIDSDYKTKR